MGIKLWGDLDLEQKIIFLQKELEILKEVNERLLEENNNLLTMISKMKKDKAFYK